MAATDDFANWQSGLDSPARHAFAITPNDGADLSHVTRGIWVGVAGNVTVDTEGGETNVTITGATAGSVIPICAKRVYSTGTTATNLTGLY